MSESRGAFRIVDVLGSGTYGIVCMARLVSDPNGPPVALKILKRGWIGSSMVERIRDEARILTRLDHFHVVHVERLIHVQGRPVLLMEWIDGVSIGRLLRALPQGLPPAVALHLARAAAVALEAVWMTPDRDGRPMHVIHRDINPSNILLTTEGVLKLIDFGIARSEMEDREAYTQQMMYGALAYSAPERDEDHTDTPAVDVYALGVTLFEMLTGRALILPHDEMRHAEAMARQLRHLAPEGVSEDMQIKLRSLIAHMCAWNARLRPSHAAVAVALSDLMARGDLLADMEAFAARHVVPLGAERKPLALDRCPECDELVDLESWPPDEQLDDLRPAARPPPAPSDAAIRRFLSHRGWEEKVPELRNLLTRTGQWTETPFLTILDRASAPWWKFWVPGADARQVAAALDVLKVRPTPAVRKRARALTAHTDPAISDAARRWLERVAC